MDKVVLLSAILCALLFVVDISRSATLYGSATVVSTPGTPEAVDAVKATPKPVSLNVEDTGLHIALCTSCQYVGQYNKIKEVVNQELPGVDVTYSEYPVSFFKSMLGYLIMAVQFGVIAISVGGERILAYFNIPMNDFVKSMMEKKFMYSMGAWYLGSFLKNMLTSTDAFEVFFDGQQIFSRLQSDPRRFPEADQLVAVIRAMLGEM